MLRHSILFTLLVIVCMPAWSGGRNAPHLGAPPTADAPNAALEEDYDDAIAAHRQQELIELTKLATAGNASAARQIATRYRYGALGAPNDTDLADYWQGEADRLEVLEDQLLRQKNFQRLSSAAEQGVSNALLPLGHAWRDGDGTPQNFAQALAYYTKAMSHQKEPNVLQALAGVLYREDVGEQRNVELAGQYWSQAAAFTSKGFDQNTAQGLAGLGCGRLIGTAKDLLEAHYWFKRALELAPDNARALAGLARVYMEGAPGLAQNLTEARRLLERAPQEKHIIQKALEQLAKLEAQPAVSLISITTH